MLKNKIAVKLTAYFAIALLAFSLIIGGIFFSLLRNHTIHLYRSQLLARAQSMASTLSGYMEGTAGMHGMGRGMMGYSAYFQFIGDIAGTDVWIVDEELNLITSGMGHGMMYGSHTYVYSDLPENADKLIKEVFTGQSVIGEDFSGLFSEATLTVGAPIQNSTGVIIGAVLLHSPVTGMDDTILEGIRLLLISLSVALAVAFMLSLWLSKSFTDPIIAKEAQDALRLERTRRDFFANISHELKTPITVIRGSLEALIDSVVTAPDQVKDYQKQMLQETTLLQRLVDDLLVLSKLQNVDFAIEKQNISLNNMLEDVSRSARQTANRKGIEIIIKTDDQSCMIYGDYGRLRQMLMILLDNAIKFSEKRGIIEVTLQNKTLSICDYGMGIPEEDLPFIFERFYQSRLTQHKQGTGLGLAIAKQIAERHEMTLSVKNGAEKGAVFILQLP